MVHTNRNIIWPGVKSFYGVIMRIRSEVIVEHQRWCTQCLWILDLSMNYRTKNLTHDKSTTYGIALSNAG